MQCGEITRGRLEANKHFLMEAEALNNAPRLRVESKILRHRLGLHPPTRRTEVGDELKLWSCFWAMGISLALLHIAPLCRDNAQRFLTVASDAALSQPTANNQTRPANPTTTVDGANPPTSLVASQRCKHAVQKVNRLGEAAVSDGEAVIFDGRGIDTEDDSSLSQDRLVRQQLAIFRQVNEGPDADTEEVVELGLVGVFGRPGVFASNEIGSGPVRVW